MNPKGPALLRLDTGILRLPVLKQMRRLFLKSKLPLRAPHAALPIKIDRNEIPLVISTHCAIFLNQRISIKQLVSEMVHETCHLTAVSKFVHDHPG